MQGIKCTQSMLRRFAFGQLYYLLNRLGPSRNAGKEFLVERHFGSISVVDGFRQEFETREDARHERPRGVFQYGQGSACDQLIPPNDRDQDSRVDIRSRHRSGSGCVPPRRPAISCSIPSRSRGRPPEAKYSRRAVSASRASSVRGAYSSSARNSSLCSWTVTSEVLAVAFGISLSPPSIIDVFARFSSILSMIRFFFPPWRMIHEAWDGSRTDSVSARLRRAVSR